MARLQVPPRPAKRLGSRRQPPFAARELLLSSGKDCASGSKLALQSVSFDCCLSDRSLFRPADVSITSTPDSLQPRNHFHKLQVNQRRRTEYGVLYVSFCNQGEPMAFAWYNAEVILSALFTRGSKGGSSRGCTSAISLGKNKEQSSTGGL